MIKLNIMTSTSHSSIPILDTDAIVLLREGHDALEVSKHQVTPGMVARAFDVS